MSIQFISIRCDAIPYQHNDPQTLVCSTRLRLRKRFLLALAYTYILNPSHAPNGAHPYIC
jgi:hypothetical protein